MKTISIPKISLAGKSPSGSAPKKLKLPDGTIFKESTCSNFDWLSNADTSEMTSMLNMFHSCSKASSIDVSGFNTALVTNMSNMFYSCSKASSIDVSGFNTALVTNMANMFGGCASLTSLDISGFNTALVTNMYNMFNSCKKLTSLDLSSFDTALVTNMSYMFAGCFALKSLVLGPNFFKTPNITTVAFSDSPWVGDTLVTSLVDNSYDRAAAGLSVMTLMLHANTKAALTDEQKAAITAKGYTIA